MKEDKKKTFTIAMRDSVKEMIPRNKFESFSAALERFIIENAPRKGKKGKSPCNL